MEPKPDVEALILVAKPYSGPRPQAEHAQVCVVMPVRAKEMEQTAKEESWQN